MQGYAKPIRPAAVIDDALLATLNQRCDVVRSSSSAAAVPSLCWGMAGRVLADRRPSRPGCGKTRRATGRLAAVFSEPFTNVAVQLKGRGGQVRPATRDDPAFLRVHVAHMAAELARGNFGEAFARNFFEHPWTALAVVRSRRWRWATASSASARRRARPSASAG
jgi:hypothetical protein